MKISFNWLKEYIQVDLTPERAAEVLTSIGLEVEGVEKVENIPGGLKGVVVGEVLECAKHPDADRLSLTKVNLGEGEPVQIVCGAPNVAAGQKVLVATVGTTLYPSSGEPLVIKKGKIRGQESLGMICAEDELGLGQSHAGIMVLDPSAVVGTPAATQLNISTDYCLEIGLTPNRTDAISHFGVARDLRAALQNMAGIDNLTVSLTKPNVPALQANSSSDAISVEVKDAEACPRYCGLTISGITVAPSPKWLQERLATIGLKPINNVVDITNFVQHEIGQPLHAFDAAKISGKKVIVRKANADEKFVTLDGVERMLDTDDLMICDVDVPMCIAGVFGGKNSGVSDSTTSIFLESAYFNPVSVRKTARRHVLNTDASFRFERGCDIDQTLWTLQRAAALIVEVCGGTVVSEITDIFPTPFTKASVVYSWARTNSLIGKELGKDRVKAILNDLDIQITAENEEALTLSIPYYRTDVTREADVVEEILRIYGYDNIEFPKGIKSSLSFPAKPDAEKVQHQVATYLSANGFSEIMSMSLTKARYRDLVNEEEYNAATSVELLNPLSNDLAVMRQSVLYSGLEAVTLNQNYRNADLRLYEFGKEYRKRDGKYEEEQHLAIFMTGRKSNESWNNGNDSVSFYDLKSAVESILRSLGIETYTTQSVEGAHYDDGLIFSHGKNVLVKLGWVAGAMLKAFDVKQPVLFADFKWANVLKALPKNAIQYKAPEKYPAVRRDLSLLFDRAVKYSDIEKLAYESERKLLRSVGLFDVYEGKNLEAGKKSYAVSFVMQDSTKTMTDQQVDQAMSRIQKALEEKLGGVLRG